MAEPPKAEPVVLADFAGLFDWIDPRDTPPGAGLDQLNLTCLQKGQLALRSGTRVVSFEPEL